MSDDTALRQACEQWVQRWLCQNNEILWERGGHYKEEVASLLRLCLLQQAEGDQQLAERDETIERLHAEMGYHEAKDVIEQLTQQLEAQRGELARLRLALEYLAALGGGHSEGNCFAQAALADRRTP